MATPTRSRTHPGGVALTAALALLAIAVGSAQLPADVVIRGVAVVDVEAGRVLPAQDIVVRGTRIEQLGPTGGALPPAKTTIDGRGKFAMPGFIDGPVRLDAFPPSAMQQLLAHGVTAVYDVASDRDRLARWRQDLATGRLYAPRIAAPCAQAPMSPPSPRPASPVTPDAVHVEVAALVQSGRTPAQALRAVTLERAPALCVDGLGRLAAGAPADLVVLGGNPLEDVRHTRALDAVVFRGQVFTYAHLQLLHRGALPLPTPTR